MGEEGGGGGDGGVKPIDRSHTFCKQQVLEL